MRFSSLPRAALPLLAALALQLPACSPKAAPVEYGPKVHGKVTYQGQPVTYGVVLFYPQTQEPASQSGGQFVPVASAMISPDGSYEIAHAPVGPVVICVATDPEVNLATFMAPTEGMGPPAGQGVGAPMPGGPAGGPPIGQEPPAGGPPMGGGGPTQPGVLPPLPKDAPLPAKMPPKPPVSPEVERMSEEQKRTLKAIHDRYGTPGKSPVFFVVPKVDEAIPFNITLK